MIRVAALALAAMLAASPAAAQWGRLGAMLHALAESKAGKGAAEAGRHADELLKAVPAPDTPSRPSETPRTGPPACSEPDAVFPAPVETLTVTGDGVNIRSCPSTSCGVIGTADRGDYRVDVIRRKACWIEAEVVWKDGTRQVGHISSTYARAAPDF